MNRRRVAPPKSAVPAHELPELEAAKRASLGQLLFKCARLFNERAIERVNQLGAYPVLRPAHTNLFPHIDFEGTRVVDLARKLGISKQAVSQTVAELEQLGVVEAFVDPSDARAKLVRFTALGRGAITHGLRILGEIEAELEPHVGQHHMLALYEALLALEATLLDDSLTAAQPPPGGGTPPHGGEALQKPSTRRKKR